MDSTAEFAQLQWRLVDQTQWRYEVIRPLVLCADRTATPRAHETATHPETEDVSELWICYPLTEEETHPSE